MYALATILAEDHSNREQQRKKKSYKYLIKYGQKIHCHR